MTYFEKIGNTISAKSREIARKAKVISETSSLNNIIKTEQHKIDTNYKMMGKLYFEKYAETPDTEFSESIDLIKLSQQKISETQDQITKIKNAHCCPNCGAAFKIDAIFCSKCGTKVKEETVEPELKEVCAECGNILEPNSLFCDLCGTKVDEELTPSDVVEETITLIPESPDLDIKEISPEFSATVSKIEEVTAEIPKSEDAVQNVIESEKLQRICSKCGEESDDTIAKFCNQCGSTLI